jgi:metal-responsive CopG/Arc/MetJ family transcriptional regulator
MSRPKIDPNLIPVIIKLGEEDRVKLDRLAEDYEIPNRSQVIRDLIRAEAERRTARNER